MNYLKVMIINKCLRKLQMLYYIRIDVLKELILMNKLIKKECNICH